MHASLATAARVQMFAFLGSLLLCNESQPQSHDIGRLLQLEMLYVIALLQFFGGSNPFGGGSGMEDVFSSFMGGMGGEHRSLMRFKC